MLNVFRNLFKKEKPKEIREYTGLSDFFVHASSDEKKTVIREAACKANEDQLKIFRAAKLKTGSNR